MFKSSRGNSIRGCHQRKMAALVSGLFDGLRYGDSPFINGFYLDIIAKLNEKAKVPHVLHVEPV